MGVRARRRGCRPRERNHVRTETEPSDGGADGCVCSPVRDNAVQCRAAQRRRHDGQRYNGVGMRKGRGRERGGIEKKKRVGKEMKMENEKERTQGEKSV